MGPEGGPSEAEMGLSHREEAMTEVQAETYPPVPENLKKGFDLDRTEWIAETEKELAAHPEKAKEILEQSIADATMLRARAAEVERIDKEKKERYKHDIKTKADTGLPKYHPKDGYPRYTGKDGSVIIMGTYYRGLVSREWDKIIEQLQKMQEKFKGEK